MTEMLSPGVYTEELDASTITPTVSNTTAGFSGKFNMGAVGTYTLNTSVADLISNHGYPDDDNYNDWFQAYNFLQYGNKLLISRAANYDGNTTSIDTTVFAIESENLIDVNECIDTDTMIQFDEDDDEEIYLVLDCEYKEAVSETALVFDTDYSYDYSSDSNYYFYAPDETLGVWDYGDGTTATVTTVGSQLEHEYDSSLEGTVVSITYTGVDGSVYVADVTIGSSDETTFTATVSDAYYQLTLDRDIENVPTVGGAISEFTRDMNGIIEVGDETCYQDTEIGDDGEERTYTVYSAPVTDEEDYFDDNKYVGNATDFDTKETSIVFTNPSASKLKIISRNPGTWCEDLKICIAKPVSFYANSSTPSEHVTKYAFEGLSVDDYFEYAPTDTQFGIIIMYDDDVVETFTVDTDKTAKDSNSKTTYVENVINVKSSYIFVKDNTSLDTVSDTTMYYDSTAGEYVGAPLELLYSTDSDIQADDLINAYEYFENKEELDVDIIIGNELDGGSSAQDVTIEREDSIAFIGANYDDCVGVKASVATLNLIDWRVSGDVSTDNMFAAVFGNYKYQYDSYNDVYRWVNLAGDMAGLRAQTTMDRASWWASAGLERGKILNVTKLAFNPTLSMRDLLYKNAINPCVVFPGMGAVCWGQKTLYSTASSFDRVNVRGLFNTLERALSKMAKYQVMEFNDTFTRNRIISMIKPYLAGVQAGRGIQDFLVICDESNNTSTVISANQLIVDIYIKPTYVAEFILLRFTNAGTNSFSSIVS